MGVDIVIETLLLVVAGVLGVSIGTAGTYLYFKSKVDSLSSQVELLKSVFQEREERLRLLLSRLDKLDDRVSILEDLTVGRTSQGEKPRVKPSLDSARDEEDREIIDLKIIALHKNGYSIRQIAREVGLSKSTVHKRLKRLLESAKT